MSHQPTPPPPGKDPVLWEIAQKRVSFRTHLLVYLVMNGFFWAIWYFSGRHYTNRGLPWAIWPTIGWGIGLVFHFVGAYVAPRANSVEEEYEKLKRNQRD